MAAINKVIELLNQDQAVILLTSPVRLLVLTPTAQAIKNGWLEKKGQKRYFVIKNGKLLWFNKMQKDDGAEANGYLLLESCSVTILPPANGKYSFRISSSSPAKNTSKRDYTLTAASEAECNDWVRHIRPLCRDRETKTGFQAAALVSGGATSDDLSIGSSAQSRRLSVRNTAGDAPAVPGMKLAELRRATCENGLLFPINYINYSSAYFLFW